MESGTVNQKNGKRIGSAIQRVRESKGMTRGELAAILGADEDAVTQYEDGTILMDVDTLFAVTMALGVTPNDIAPGSVMESAASGLGDYARLSDKSKRMVDQVITMFLRDQRAEGNG